MPARARPPTCADERRAVGQRAQQQRVLAHPQARRAGGGHGAQPAWRRLHLQQDQLVGGVFGQHSSRQLVPHAVGRGERDQHLQAAGEGQHGVIRGAAYLRLTAQGQRGALLPSKTSPSPDLRLATGALPLQPRQRRVGDHHVPLGVPHQPAAQRLLHRLHPAARDGRHRRHAAQLLRHDPVGAIWQPRGRCRGRGRPAAGRQRAGTCRQAAKEGAARHERRLGLVLLLQRLVLAGGGGGGGGRRPHMGPPGAPAAAPGASLGVWLRLHAGHPGRPGKWGGCEGLHGCTGRRRPGLDWGCDQADGQPAMAATVCLMAELPGQQAHQDAPEAQPTPNSVVAAMPRPWPCLTDCNPAAPARLRAP